MRYLKFFESFKYKNFTQQDIRDCIINSKGFIYATIINNLPDNIPNNPLRPVSIDDDGLITVQVLDEKGQPIDGSEYEVELKNVEKIEF